jgi:hypothetical protein
VLALLVLGGCGSSHVVTIAVPSRAVALESIFDPGPQLVTDPAATFGRMRALGADRVRMFVHWNSVAPDPSSSSTPSGFDAADPAEYPATAWAPYDAIIRAAAARRVAIDLTLGGPPPLWASGPGAPQPSQHPQWAPSAADYGAFVRAVGTRYSGHYTPPGATRPLPRVDFWAIWNEPNYGPDLAPQAIDDSTVEVSPRIYRGLVGSAYSALHATGHGRDTIVIGELAPRGITVGNSPGNFSGMVPLRFMRALYCVDLALQPLQGSAATSRGCPATPAGSRGFAAANPGLFEISGIAVHPYPQGQVAPNVPAANEPDYADLPALPRLEHLLSTVAHVYGTHRELPLYSTEFGYQTNPPEKIDKAVNPAQAAIYLNWSEYISWLDPHILSYDQYLLTDPAGANSQGGFASGLEFKDGARKVTYDAYRMPIFLPVTSFSADHELQVWGCVRPIRYGSPRTGSRSVQIQFAAGTSGSFKTVRTVPLNGPGCYFDVGQTFAGTGSVRLAWSYPNGPQIFSRTVKVALR